MTYNETHTHWSWYILFTNPPLKMVRQAWSAAKIVFHCWRCLWRHHWVTRMDDFLGGEFFRHTPYAELNQSTLKRQRCWSDRLLCYSTRKIIPSVEYSGTERTVITLIPLPSAQIMSWFTTSGKQFCFLHVWVLPVQIADAPAQILEPVGFEDPALLIMQTKCSIMDPAVWRRHKIV